MNELALTESPSLRAQYADRVDVLEKVKALVMLPDGLHMSTELVADYYEVDVEAIKSIARRNHAELESNGYKVVRGADLREFERVNLTPSPNRRSLRLFVRRTILNVGQMLTESPVAEAVRKHLLDTEERSRDTIARQVDPFDPDTYTWKETCTVIRQQFGVRVSVPRLRRVLRSAGVLTQTFEPKAEFSDWFWFTGTAHEVFAHQIPPLFYQFERADRLLRAFGSERPSLPPAAPAEIPFGEDES